MVPAQALLLARSGQDEAALALIDARGEALAAVAPARVLRTLRLLGAFCRARRAGEPLHGATPALPAPAAVLAMEPGASPPELATICQHWPAFAAFLGRGGG